MDQATTMVGLWEWDAETKQDWVDDQLAAFLQATDSVKRDRPASLLALLAENDRQRLLAAAERAWKTRCPLDEVISLRGVDGSRRCIYMRGSSLPSGRSNSLVAVCRVESQPDADLQDLLNGLVETMPLLIVVLNQTGELRYVNRRVEKLLGYELPELKKLDWVRMFLDPSEQPRIENALAQALQGQGIQPLRTRIRSASGDVLIIEWSAGSTWPADQHAAPIVGVGLDITEQDHAERDLRVKQRALEQSINGIVIADMEGRLTFVNDAFLRSLRYSSAAEVLGKHGLGFCADQALGAQVIARLQAGAAWVGEMTLIRKDGSPIEMLLSATLIRDHDGKPQWMMASHIDITERKQQEQALRSSEANQRLSESYLRAIFDSSPECIKVVDKNCRLIDMNQAGIRALEVESLEQIRGSDICEWVVPEDRDRFHRAVQSACAGGRSTDVFRMISAKGNRRWMEQHAVGLIGPEGVAPLERMVSVTRDVTERMQIQADQALAQAALRESEAQLQLLLKYAPAGVAMLDRDLKYIAYSQRWLADYHLEGQELLGRSHYEVFPEIPERWKEIHRRCLQGAVERCERDLFERADGTATWLRWEIQPWRDAEGKIGGLVLFTEDVSKDVKSEEEVQSLRNQAAHAGRIATMGEMAAGIAHELNQPLAAISLYAEGCVTAAQSGTIQPAEMVAKFDEIAILASRCGEIIRRLRAFATKRDSRRTTVDLREILASSLQLLRHEYRIAGVECSVNLPPEPLWLVANNIELQQVFINILRNALEATTSQSGGETRVEVTAARISPERCCVTIRDRGVGVPLEQLPELFTPFFTTKPKGLGMGLKICATIVQAHRGEIECRPAAGGGTAFLIHLPIAAPLPQ